MKITGFEDIISFDTFYYCLKVGEHERCQFRVVIREENFTACLNRLGKECTLEDDIFKFSGTISEISADKGFDCCYVSVTVMGRTIEFDREAKYRVFQSGEKKVSDILDKMGMSEIKYSASDDEDIPYIIVQKNETDWMFLNRLADHLGKRLFPGDKIWFGDASDKTEEVNEDDIIEMHVTLNDGRSEIFCRLKKTLVIGEKVALYGKGFFVDAVIYKKDNEAYVYEYHLKENVKQRASKELPVYYLTARIQDNNDPDKLGRVKLEFLEPYEDYMKDDAVWIECSSLWSSKELGVACIPLKDDVVCVMIADRKAIVYSAKRVEKFDGRFDDPNTRYVFVGENTYFAVNDERVIIDNSKYRCEITDERLDVAFGEKMSIAIDENGISTVADKSKMKIESKEIMAATDKTTIQLTDGTKIKTNSFEADGKNKVAITASKIDIKGKSGVSIN